MGAMPSSSNIRAMNWAVGQRELTRENESAAPVAPIERRIAELIAELKREMGTGFTDFYRNTSMSPRLLEQQLSDKLSEIRGVSNSQ